MPAHLDALLRQLLGGDPATEPELLERAADHNRPQLLVAAALLGDHSEERLVEAATHAVTARDRQLVAIATAHLEGDDDLFDALVRDHLADHPDSVLAAWIAATHVRPD